MKFTGVDGCKIGWFYVGFEDNGRWHIGTISRISELSGFLQNSEVILVDIPIGLRDYDSTERLCDLAARKALKAPRSSSVFPAPSRLAINCATYDEASEVNRRYTGRRLSKQSWAIAAKIKQMDEFLCDVEADGKIREIHPEVCFWALNNSEAMKYNKRKTEGFQERLAVLSKYLESAEQIVDTALQEYRRKDVARDDIVDAVVAAVTASFYKSLATLPEEPEFDGLNLPMEIVFARIEQKA